MSENDDIQIHTEDNNELEDIAEIRISSINHDNALDFPAAHTSRDATPTMTSFADSPKMDYNEQEMEDIQLDDQTTASPRSMILPSSPIAELEKTKNETHNKIDSNYLNMDYQRNNEFKVNNKVTITITHASDDAESMDETELPNINNNKSDNDDLSSHFKRTTVIHSIEESTEDTFNRLKLGCQNGVLSQKEIIDGLFNLLVGGPFDLESRFIIGCSENIEKMLEFIEISPKNMQAEIWSVFVAIVRKSFRNLEACSRVGLISKCVDLLPSVEAIISDLLIQLLTVLSSYSITVKEVKRVLRALQAQNGYWSKNSAKLLAVMQEMPKREGADVFFSFPGNASAVNNYIFNLSLKGIALPPLTKWPYQNGWTFSTWFRMDPLNSVNFEKEKPYLFW